MGRCLARCILRSQCSLGDLVVQALCVSDATAIKLRIMEAHIQAR
jgi:hypothetical protein